MTICSPFRAIPAGTAGAETAVLPSAATGAGSRRVGAQLDLPATGGGAAVAAAPPRPVEQSARRHRQRTERQRQDVGGVAAGRSQLFRTRFPQDPSVPGGQRLRESSFAGRR